MPAHAGDWSLQSKLSGTAEVDDNYLLLADPDGAVFVSTVEVYGDFIYKSHASQLDLIADIIGQSFAGPGSDGLSDKLLPKLDAKYHQDGKRTDFDLRASYVRDDLQSVNQNDGIDVVDTTSNSISNTLSAGGGVTHRVDLRNSVVFLASAERVTYEGEGTNNTGAETSATWNRRLTKNTDGTLGIDFRYLALEDDESTDRYVYGTRAGMASKLSKRLGVIFGAGLNLVDSYKTDVKVQGRPRNSTVDLGYAFDAGIDYALKEMSISLKANYGLEPSSQGDLENRASLDLLVSRAINEHSSVSFSAGAQMAQNFSSTGNKDRTYGLYLEPSYSRALTDEWTLKAGYRYLLQDESGTLATSNNVYLSLTRDFIAIR